MSSAGSSTPGGGYGLGRGKADDLDAQTAYNLELSRQMTVPDKIVLADRLSQHPSPAASFLHGNPPGRRDMEQLPASLLESRRMNVPDRILYGDGTPPNASSTGGAMRSHLPDLDDRAVRHSPAMAMVTPPDRLTVIDDIGQSTPVARPAQPRAVPPSTLADSPDVDASDRESAAVHEAPRGPLKYAQHRAEGEEEEKEEDNDEEEDDEEDEEFVEVQHQPEERGSRKLVDRVAALEERVADLERRKVGSPTGPTDGDKALALLVFAFWIINPLVLYVMKKSR